MRAAGKLTLTLQLLSPASLLLKYILDCYELDKISVGLITIQYRFRLIASWKKTDADICYYYYDYYYLDEIRLDIFTRNVKPYFLLKIFVCLVHFFMKL